MSKCVVIVTIWRTLSLSLSSLFSLFLFSFWSHFLLIKPLLLFSLYFTPSLTLLHASADCVNFTHLQSFTLILDDMTCNRETVKSLFLSPPSSSSFFTSFCLTFILSTLTRCVFPSLSLLYPPLLALSLFAGSLPKWVVNRSSHYLAPRVSNLQIGTVSECFVCLLMCKSTDTALIYTLKRAC